MQKALCGSDVYLKLFHLHLFRARVNSVNTLLALIACYKTTLVVYANADP